MTTALARTWIDVSRVFLIEWRHLIISHHFNVILDFMIFKFLYFPQLTSVK